MKNLCLAAVLAVAATGAAHAQDMTAQKFVDEATASGMFEIDSSKLALKHTDDKGLDDFAQKMIDDHTKAGAKLESVAMAENLTVPKEIMGKPAMLLKEVEDADGTSFQSVYAKNQVAGHEATVQLFENYAASGDDAALVSFAKETLPTLKMHLDMAKTLPEM